MPSKAVVLSWIVTDREKNVNTIIDTRDSLSVSLPLDEPSPCLGEI